MIRIASIFYDRVSFIRLQSETFKQNARFNFEHVLYSNAMHLRPSISKACVKSGIIPKFYQTIGGMQGLHSVERAVCDAARDGCEKLIIAEADVFLIGALYEHDISDLAMRFILVNGLPSPWPNMMYCNPRFVVENNYHFDSVKSLHSIWNITEPLAWRSPSGKELLTLSIQPESWRDFARSQIIDNVWLHVDQASTPVSAGRAKPSDILLAKLAAKFNTDVPVSSKAGVVLTDPCKYFVADSECKGCRKEWTCQLFGQDFRCETCLANELI